MEDPPPLLAKSGAKEIVEKLRSIPGGNVLDICTGSGDFIEILMLNLKHSVSFLGVDRSKEDLESGRKRFAGQPVEFREMDARVLNFEDGRHDTVSMANSIHHLDDTRKVLAEMIRVLKPGGHFIINEPYRDGEQSEAQKTEILRHHWDSEIDSMLGITHHHTLAKQELRLLINSLGLRSLEILDSTRHVKCLSCKHRFECEDPKSEKSIKDAIEEIEKDLERLKGYTEARTLREQGERLKERVKQFGSADASSLFFVGKK
jgi:ubiquinone/menaquinone biosynthesis C-methylase UbiE